MWPTRPEQLVEVQRTLAMEVTEPWVPGDGPPRVAACWVCFPRGLAGPGAAGDQAWAAVVDLPTVGVTHRPLVADGAWPADEDGASSPLRIDGPDGEEVGRWLRTRAGTRPLAVHAGWRTEPAVAAAVVRMTVRGRRTPEPLRRARQLARRARAAARPRR